MAICACGAKTTSPPATSKASLVARAYIALARENTREPAPRPLAEAALLSLGRRVSDATDNIDHNVALLAAADPGGERSWEVIQSMIESLDDPHVHLFTADRLAMIGEAMSGKEFVAAGLAMHALPDGDWVVRGLLPGSAAERAGVELGDRITTIEGRAPSTFRVMDLLVMRPAGTRVELGTRRGPLVLDLVPILPPIAEHRIVNDVGVIAVHMFTVPADPPRDLITLVENAFIDFDRAGVRTVVLDLRGNVGGYTGGAFRVASLFIDADPIIDWADRRGSDSDHRVGDAWPTRRPFAVLVDDQTVSAGEILAYALQQRGASVIGQRTAGALNFPDLIEIGDRKLWIPTAWAVSPTTKERAPDFVTPDEVVPNRTPEDLAAGRDPQLDAAIHSLRPR